MSDKNAGKGPFPSLDPFRPEIILNGKRRDGDACQAHADGRKQIFYFLRLGPGCAVHHDGVLWNALVVDFALNFVIKKSFLFIDGIFFFGRPVDDVFHLICGNNRYLQTEYIHFRGGHHRPDIAIIQRSGKCRKR